MISDELFDTIMFFVSVILYTIIVIGIYESGREQRELRDKERLEKRRPWWID